MELVDRYLGSMFGLAVGDAIGTTLEFTKPGDFEPITDMVGGGPFQLPVGCWTDDTSMALCLAASIIETQGFDPYDQMVRYTNWLEQGYMSSTMFCFDIGNATRNALIEFRERLANDSSVDAFCGSTNPLVAGNGSIMRLAPVVLGFLNESNATAYIEDSSKTTHSSPECIDACILFGTMITMALRGESKESIFDPKNLMLELEPRIRDIALGSYKTKNPPEIRGDGYVVLSLEAALWAFYNSDSYEEGVLKAANLGEDADTTAAVYGQLAGAYYGYDAIPSKWTDKIAKKELIRDLSIKLHDFANKELEHVRTNT